mgnify:CR=1 FL=1
MGFWSVILATFLGTSVQAADVEIVAEQALYGRAMGLIANRFMYPDEFVPFEALVSASEAAEDAIPWLIAESDGYKVTLSHGETGEFATVTLVLSDGELTAYDWLGVGLAELEVAIRSQGAEIPDDVDLPVELMRGVCREMDKHSVVLAKKRLARFDQRITGKLTGVGSKIGLVDDELTVKEVFADGPADLGGLLKDDVILAVDGFSTSGLSVSQSVDRIRGVEGTTVVLTIRRKGVGTLEDRQFDLPFVRAKVLIPNVSWHRLDSGVGVMEIEHFSEQTTKLMQEAFLDFASWDSPGIVVDLRGNSGGSMIQACGAVDLFLTSGPILSTVGREGRRVKNLLREYQGRDEGVETQAPVVVLIDRGSASASEILAGALSLRDRALLIGERSHGKGTVQKLFTIRPGEPDEKVRLKMTVAEYRLTGDTAIEAGVGIEPDLWVEPVVFSSGGASVPIDPTRDELGGMLQYVVEAEGWRVGVEEDLREVFLVELAERVLLQAEGAHRLDLMESLEQVVREVEKEETQRLVETFGYRSLDWAGGEADEVVPVVSADVQVVDAPIAGDEVEVRVAVQNNGTTPIHRSWVRLTTSERRLPWNGLTLPVGRVDPGEVGYGSAVTRIGRASVDRIDPVMVTLMGEGFSSVGLDPVWLAIQDREEQSVSLESTIQPEGDHHRFEVNVKNHGDTVLTGVRVKVGLVDDSAIELLAREGVVPAIKPRSTTRIDLPFRYVHPLEEPEEVRLKVEAEDVGTLIVTPLVVPIANGRASQALPVVEVGQGGGGFTGRGALRAVPTQMEPGPLQLVIRAQDDSEIRSVTVWKDGDKVAWRAGGARKIVLEIPVDITVGSQLFQVAAMDDQEATGLGALVVWGAGSQGEDGTVEALLQSD